MRNTLNAAKLDFSLVKSYIKGVAFTMLIPIAFTVGNRSLLTGVSFAMYFISMTTGYTFSVMEKNSMERLYGILPIKKSELVIGRYFFIFALGLLNLTVTLIIQSIVLWAMGERLGASDIVSAAIIGLFLFALYTACQIPGFYKYGSIRGRVFIFIPVIGFLLTLFLLPKLPEIRFFTIISSPVLLIPLALVLIVIIYAISIWFSVRIMENKEI